MRRILLVFAALTIGCGRDSATQPAEASIVGTWDLRTINGSSLPFVLSQSGADKAEVMSDVATADDHGAYTEVTQFRTTLNGQATTQAFTDAGTYTVNGNAVTLRSGDGSSVTASLSENTFAISSGAFVYIYKKR